MPSLLLTVFQIRLKTQQMHSGINRNVRVTRKTLQSSFYQNVISICSSVFSCTDTRAIALSTACVSVFCVCQSMWDRTLVLSHCFISWCAGQLLGLVFDWQLYLGILTAAQEEAESLSGLLTPRLQTKHYRAQSASRLSLSKTSFMLSNQSNFFFFFLMVIHCDLIKMAAVGIFILGEQQIISLWINFQIVFSIMIWSIKCQKMTQKI